MNFFELAQKRCSIRSFAEREIEQEKLDQILEAARIAPTAANRQPFRIYVVKSEQNIAKMRAAVRCAFNAPVVLVFCSVDSEAWKNEFSGWSAADTDVAIVQTHAMLAAEALGLGTCWVAWFDAARLKADFPFPEGVEPVGLLPLGYAAEDAAPSAKHSVRRSAEELIKTI